MPQASKPLLPDTGFLEALLRIADEGVVVHDSGGKIVFCNAAAERILGRPGGRIVGDASADFEPVTLREDGSPFPADEHPAMVTLRTGEPCRNVIMGLEWNPEIAPTWVKINSAVIPAGGVCDAMVFAVFSDITEEVEARRRLRGMAARLQAANGAMAEAESRMRGLLNAIPDLVWLKDMDGVYLFCNEALAKRYNVTAAAVIGKTDYDFSPAWQADYFREKDLEAARGEGPLVIEERVAFLGSPAWRVVETLKVPMRDEAGRLLGVLGIARDVSERSALRERLRETNTHLTNLARELQLLARTDPLTRLPNRRAFEEAMSQEFRRAMRFGAAASVLMIDVDFFKRVNDDYGHEAGDAALVALAGALRANCRVIDVPARLGGEEFALLLPGTGGSGAVAIAERLREAVARTEVLAARRRFGVTVSIGVACVAAHDAEWAQVVARADQALYEAKSCGRDRVCVAAEGRAAMAGQRPARRA